MARRDRTVIGTLALAALIAVTNARAEPRGVRLLVERNGFVVTVSPSGRAEKRVLAAGAAVWSPDGTLLAYVHDADLWLANADGTGRRALTRTPNVQESEPTWAPGGKTIAYTAVVDGGRQIRVLRLPSGRSRRVAAAVEEWSPAFSPDGAQLAFVSTRLGAPKIFVAAADGSGPTPFGPADAAEPAGDLAWSPDGTQIAATAPGAVVLVAADTWTTVASGAQPVWSPSGEQLAYTDGTQVLVVRVDGTPVARPGPGTPLDWRRVPVGRALFPDLRQRPPAGLVLMRTHGRWLLGFTSLVDNVGPGALWLRGVRTPGSSTMKVTQLVTLAGGGSRAVRGAGRLRYTVAPPHHHWHLLGFEHYELRRAGDFRLLVTDRKSGFCIADHYGIAPGVHHGPPRFLGNCAQFDPRARNLDEGSSVGYTDRYPGFFHGQQLDVTRVPAGRYWLVHRANEDFGLREARYGNDTASLLVKISWPGGHKAVPRVVPLRACRKERC